jgi:hypothetical protein
MVHATGEHTSTASRGPCAAATRAATPVNRPSPRALAALAALVAAGLFANGCAHAPRGGGADGSSRQRARYEAAVVDAAVVETAEIVPLRPLPTGADGRATVVTLTDYAYTVGSQELGREVWVTVVPEVQERCRRFGSDPRLRLLQLLGLPPHKPIVHFAVLSVAAADVFRPALDPNPTSRQPCDDPAATSCAADFPPATPPAHLQWIAGQMATSYVRDPAAPQPAGYPWTRLGYTYDWAPGADEYGASEYVVRRGATVEVLAVVPYRDYCAGNG